MGYIKLFEHFKEVITLYHGTCDMNAFNLIENGWHPNLVKSGSNQGNPMYLYLSSDKEDAKWFAEQKGCDVVLKVIDIPIEYLIFDPEDGDADIYDYKISNAISKIKKGYPIPIKFALVKPLSKEHFKYIEHT